MIDATLALIAEPDLPLPELMKIIPGPDFPTGGLILGRSGIRSAFETGRGSIPLRARCEIEDMRGGRQAIIATELPYQVNKASLIEKIAELVRAKAIEGISDLRDESDRDGLRVVIDTHGPALTAALRVGVYAFKPSLRELRDLTGLTLPDTASQKAAAQALIHSGQVEVVALTWGEDGAMWVTAQHALMAESLPVNVRTTIGAGDSFVGGWLWSWLQGHDATLQFRTAMAASAAALLGEGTSLCQADDVHRLMADVQVREI